MYSDASTMKLTTYNANCVINSFFVIDAICVNNEKMQVQIYVFSDTCRIL